MPNAPLCLVQKRISINISPIIRRVLDTSVAISPTVSAPKLRIDVGFGVLPGENPTLAASVFAKGP